MIRNQLEDPYRSTRIKLVGANAYRLHDHTFGEVCWVDEGEGLYHILNGKKVPHDGGMLFFMRPWDAHSMHVEGDEPVFLFNVSFQWYFFERLKQRYFPDCSSLYGEEGEMPKMVRLTQTQRRNCREAVIALMKAPKAVFHIERFLINLFADFYPATEHSFLGQAPSWMRNAWNLIQQPEHLRLGVKEFYRLCGRCPEHVSREFQRQTGQTVAQCVGYLRMAHAAALLAGTTEDIIDISRDCGFESLSHFYVCFRKAYGCTPRDYRKNAQREMYPKESPANLLQQFAAAPADPPPVPDALPTPNGEVLRRYAQ